jgi:hypothetical protein
LAKATSRQARKRKRRRKREKEKNRRKDERYYAYVVDVSLRVSVGRALLGEGKAGLEGVGGEGVAPVRVGVEVAAAMLEEEDGFVAVVAAVAGGGERAWERVGPESLEAATASPTGCPGEEAAEATGRLAAGGAVVVEVSEAELTAGREAATVVEGDLGSAGAPTFMGSVCIL